MLPDAPQKETEIMPDPTEAAAGEPEPEQLDTGAVTQSLDPARPGGTQPGFVGAFVRTAKRGHAGSVPARVALAVTVVVVAAAAVVISGALLHSSSVKLTSASGSAGGRGGQANGAGARPLGSASPARSSLRPSARPRPAPGALPAAPVSGPQPGGPVPAPAPVGHPAPKPAHPAAARPAAAHPAPPPAKIAASGQVTCLSGNAVEGVWVVGQGGGTGWAAWSPSGSQSVATFSRTIPTSAWEVHVGCGGSPQSWQVATYSGWMTGTSQSITCDDISGQGQFGECLAG
jgi:hypothetical protein